MGSNRSFEVSFRCAATLAVFIPVTLLLSHIPTVGVALGIIWAAYSLIVASQQTHSLETTPAIAVFAVIAVILIYGALYPQGEPLSGKTTLFSDSQPAAKNQEPVTDSEATPSQVKPLVEEDEASVIAKTINLEPIKMIETASSEIDNTQDLSVNDVAMAIEDDNDVVKTEQRFAEENRAVMAGKVLGELVKEVSEMAQNVGEEIKQNMHVNAPSSTEKKPATDETANAVGESGQAVVAKEQQKEKEKEKESNQAKNSMTAEELGKALGMFIRQVNEAAESVNQGFREGMQESKDTINETTNATANKAGEALGDFIRGFNQAVEGLEKQSQQEQ